MSPRTPPSPPNRRALTTGVSLVAGRQPLIQILLATGRWSSSQAAKLLSAGRVRAWGRALVDPAQRIDPWHDMIEVDERLLPPPQPCRYLLFHKPYHVLSSFTDPDGRATLGDYIPVPGVYAVGRLDYDSEGLMLLTDDGWLNHRLAHPQYEHPKTYWVQVERAPDAEAIEMLRRGVLIQGRRTAPAEVTPLRNDQLRTIPARAEPIRYRASVPTAWLQIVLREGAKRQLRHMTAAVGFPTLRLIRIAIGPLVLGDLAPGAWREMGETELDLMRSWLRERRATETPSQPRSSPVRRTQNRRRDPR